MNPSMVWILTLSIACFAGCDDGGDNENAQSIDSGPIIDVTTPADLGDTAVVDAGRARDAVSVPDEMGFAFTHKMVKQTGENPFASLAYECPQCSFAQWERIDPPEGWTKGPAQIGLFSAPHSALRSHPEIDGHAASMDFLEEVPGNEYQLIAITRSGRLVQRGPGGIVAEVQVQRDTRLVFKPGMRVHQLTDPEGHIFVLFAHHVDTNSTQAIDFQSEDALAYLTPPTGYTYSTRILEEDLALDSNNHDGVVTVLAIRSELNSTWEKL